MELALKMAGFVVISYKWVTGYESHSEEVIVMSFGVSITLEWSKDTYMYMNKSPDVISIDVPTLWYCSHFIYFE